jgi:hypothetical protein
VARARRGAARACRDLALVGRHNALNALAALALASSVSRSTAVLAALARFEGCRTDAKRPMRAACCSSTIRRHDRRAQRGRARRPRPPGRADRRRRRQGQDFAPLKAPSTRTAAPCC